MYCFCFNTVNSLETLNFYFRCFTINRSVLAISNIRSKNKICSYFSFNRKLLPNKNYPNILTQNPRFNRLSMQVNENFQNENLIQNLTEDGGVNKKIIKPGNGIRVDYNSTVRVHYVGKLDSGLVFDSSYDRKEPYIFSIGENKVIKGWEIGIKSMCVGEKAQFEISSDYGYKKKGIPPIIPPNAKLIFDIELLEVSLNEVNVNKIQLNLDSVSTNDQKAELDNYKESVEQSQEMFKKSIRNFFFISPFRSQSGENAPWWLNPNLTFILVFLVVFILFEFVSSIGGIHQGYVGDSFNANFLK